MKKVYLAAALFSEAEREFNKKLRDMMVGAGMEVFLPQEDSNDHDKGHSPTEHTFEQNVEGIERADIVVAVLDGVDVDSGTAWEIGYAMARGKPVVGIRTDFRTLGCEGAVNLMIGRSVRVICRNAGELLAELGKL